MKKPDINTISYTKSVLKIHFQFSFFGQVLPDVLILAQYLAQSCHCQLQRFSALFCTTLKLDILLVRNIQMQPKYLSSVCMVLLVYSALVCTRAYWCCHNGCLIHVTVVRVW